MRRRHVALAMLVANVLACSLIGFKLVTGTPAHLLLRGGVAAVALGLLVLSAWRQEDHTPHTGLLWPVLLLLVYPYEADFSTVLDPPLQNLTAWCALPVVRFTGLDVQISGTWLAPVLAGSNLEVTITRACAGAQTLLTLLTLGTFIAEVFLRDAAKRLLFVALTPAFGFAGNVIRVAASTHAASHWGADAWSWTLAHDSIGYATFAVTYVALFFLARRLRVATPMTPSMHSHGNMNPPAA